MNRAIFNKQVTNCAASLRKGLIAFCLLLLFSSCNSNADRQANSREDTTQAATNIIPPKDTVQVKAPTRLFKNTLVDENYFERQSKLAAVLSQQQLKVLGVEKLLPGEQVKNDPELKLKIIDTVFTGHPAWVIIARQTDNELWAWLAALDSTGKIASSKLVFYQDFVEYFSTTSTRITDSTVVITTTADNGESKSTKTAKYRLTDKQQLKIIR